MNGGAFWRQFQCLGDQFACFFQAQVAIGKVVAQCVVGGGRVRLQAHDGAHVLFQLGELFQLPVDIAAGVEQLGIFRLVLQGAIQNAQGIWVAFLFFKNVRMQQRSGGFFGWRIGWQLGQQLQGQIELAVLHQPFHALQLRLLAQLRQGNVIQPLLCIFWFVEGVGNASQHQIGLQVAGRGLL